MRVNRYVEGANAACHIISLLFALVVAFWRISLKHSTAYASSHATNIITVDKKQLRALDS